MKTTKVAKLGLAAFGAVLVGLTVCARVQQATDPYYSAENVAARAPKVQVGDSQEQIMAAVDEGEWFKNRFGEKCLKVSDSEGGRRMAASYGLKVKYMAWLGGNKGEIFNTQNEAENASANHYADGRYYTTLVGCQIDN